MNTTNIRLLLLSLIVATCTVAVTIYLNAKKRKKVLLIEPFARSPLSEKSAMIIRNANYVCRCHETKPYDVCILTTPLESEDVLSIRSSESGHSSDDDNATKEVMLNMVSSADNTERQIRESKK